MVHALKRTLWVCAAVLTTMLATASGWGQALSAAAPKPAPAASPIPSAAPLEEPIAPDSPRASMTHFLEFARAGHFRSAAQYLDVPKEREADAQNLARELTHELDRYAWLDPDTLSPRPNGDLDDGLPANFEKVGTVATPSGEHDPILLSRSGGKDAKWIFSRATVGKIDDWYQTLDDRWFLDHLPPLLLRVGPRDLLYWQWIALPLLLIAAAVVGACVNWASGFVLVRVAKRTKTPWDDAILDRLKSPAALAWTLVVTYFATPYLELYKPAELFLSQLLRGGFLFCFFWALARLVDVVAEMVLGSSWGTKRIGSRGLMSLSARVGKLVVVAIAVVAFLSELGYPVTSLIAGLGIGGLALALAAQKTVENLFGAFSISADEPFRVGDFIKVDGISGSVERIGLRSTKIRTADRTVITMPNGKLADMRVESFAPRDRYFYSATLRLSHDTEVGVLREILANTEKFLLSQPKVREESVVVRLSEIAESSFDVSLTIVFDTTSDSEFQLMKQNLLLGLMELVHQAGAALAHPTRTVQLVEQPGSRSERQPSSSRSNRSA